MFDNRIVVESTGKLPGPKYYCDAFILKTIIYNADRQKLAIAEQKYKKPTEKNIL